VFLWDYRLWGEHLKWQKKLRGEAFGSYPRYPGASWATARFIVNLETLILVCYIRMSATSEGQCKSRAVLESRQISLPLPLRMPMPSPQNGNDAIASPQLADGPNSVSLI